MLICNPWSGGGKVAKFGLVEIAEEIGVEVVLLDHGLDLAELARDAIARGADCLGMAGGDGSQALVASIALEHGIPFVCVSAGTRNHFALDLGFDREDPRRAWTRFATASSASSTTRTVGDRLFVNNVSLGIYATIVQQDGYRDAKLRDDEGDAARDAGPSGRAVRPAVHRRPTASRSTTPSSSRCRTTPTCWASPDVSQRRSMDSGKLGVLAINAKSGARGRGRGHASAIGPGRPRPALHEFTTETVRGAVALRQGLRRRRR